MPDITVTETERAVAVSPVSARRHSVVEVTDSHTELLRDPSSHPVMVETDGPAAPVVIETGGVGVQFGEEL